MYRDETCDMYIDEDEWNQRNDERMRLFWQGLDSTETPAQPQCLETFFYNPQGGRYYHSVAQCRSISPEYWDGMKSFDRAMLGEDAYSALLPCPFCCASEVTP